VLRHSVPLFLALRSLLVKLDAREFLALQTHVRDHLEVDGAALFLEKLFFVLGFRIRRALKHQGISDVLPTLRFDPRQLVVIFMLAIVHSILVGFAFLAIIEFLGENFDVADGSLLSGVDDEHLQLGVLQLHVLQDLRVQQRQLV